MLLHLGSNIAILNQEIVAILDYNSIKKSLDNQAVLNKAAMIHREKNIKIKSVVLTQEEIYFSPISSLTLQNRVNPHRIVKGEAYGQ
jgi:hypothetical protein